MSPTAPVGCWLGAAVVSEAPTSFAGSGAGSSPSFGPDAQPTSEIAPMAKHSMNMCSRLTSLPRFNFPVSVRMLSERNQLGRVLAHYEVVHRYDGYNRSAEGLLLVEDDPAPEQARAKVVPIGPRGTDSYRMIFIADEIPRFDHPSVSIVSVE